MSNKLRARSLDLRKGDYWGTIFDLIVGQADQQPEALLLRDVDLRRDHQFSYGDFL